jgi:pyruvate formate lyase activating enzyme
LPGRAEEPPAPAAHEADWYEKLEGKQVRCVLCPRKCVVADRERGYCGVRENRDGTYFTLVHSRPCAVHSDPIEKKPLYHVLPGTTAFSIATAGCNMECRFCQNWQISQFRPEQIRSYDLPPDAVARLAKDRGDATIATTYTEPVVFAEYVRDCAKAGKRRGVGSVMISNGYITEGALRDLVPHLTAVKIDLKAFTKSFYRDTCSGELEPRAPDAPRAEGGGHLVRDRGARRPDAQRRGGGEPGHVPVDPETLGPQVPVHLTRFPPDVQAAEPAPDPGGDARPALPVGPGGEARLRLRGERAGHPSESTTCPGCGRPVVRRRGSVCSAST